MKLPDYPIPGEPIPASWGRQVVDFLRSLMPRSSPQVLPAWSPNGTTWRLLPGRRAIGAAAPNLPWAVTVTSDGSVRCAGGRFVARLNGATLLSQDVAADEALGEAVDGQSVHLLYTHRCADGTPPSVSLQYGELPAETAEALPIEIAKITGDDGSWTVVQHEASAVLVEDAHRGQVKMFLGDADDIPSFWEVLTLVGGVPTEGRAPVGAGSTFAVNTAGGVVSHTHRVAETGDVTYGYPPDEPYMNTANPPNVLMRVVDLPSTDPADPGWFAVHFIRRT